MSNELSPDRILSMFVQHFRKDVTVRSGPLTGVVGRPVKIGVDGRVVLSVKANQATFEDQWFRNKVTPDEVVSIEVDWLDSDMATPTLRAAYRARRTVQRGRNQLLPAWGRLLPSRIANEDLGDYVERYHAALAGAVTESPALVVLEAIVVTLWNASIYWGKRLLTRTAAR